MTLNMTSNGTRNMTIEALVRRKLKVSKAQDKSLVISVVGAGGKTSLIYHLASQLKSEFKVLVTTTTMMFKPTDELDHILYQEDLQESAFLEKLEAMETLVSTGISAQTGKLETTEKLERAETLEPLETSKSVTELFLNEVGEGFDIDGSKVIKLKGVTQTLVDQIAKAHLYDLILIEADGSRRRPLKAYGTHEPVLPQCSDMTFVVMGLKGFNAPVTDQTVHRLEQFLKLTGKRQGDHLQVEDLIALFRGEEGFLKAVPKGCDVIAIFNQADCLTQSPDFSSLSEGLFNISPSIWGFFVVSLEKNLTYATYLNKLDGER